MDTMDKPRLEQPVEVVVDNTNNSERIVSYQSARHQQALIRYIGTPPLKHCYITYQSVLQPLYNLAQTLNKSEGDRDCCPARTAECYRHVLQAAFSVSHILMAEEGIFYLDTQYWDYYFFPYGLSTNDGLQVWKLLNFFNGVELNLHLLTQAKILKYIKNLECWKENAYYGDCPISFFEAINVAVLAEQITEGYQALKDWEAFIFSLPNIYQAPCCAYDDTQQRHETAYNFYLSMREFFETTVQDCVLLVLERTIDQLVACANYLRRQTGEVCHVAEPTEALDKDEIGRFIKNSIEGHQVLKEWEAFIHSLPRRYQVFRYACKDTQQHDDTLYECYLFAKQTFKRTLKSFVLACLEQLNTQIESFSALLTQLIDAHALLPKEIEQLEVLYCNIDQSFLTILKLEVDTSWQQTVILSCDQSYLLSYCQTEQYWKETKELLHRRQFLGICKDNFDEHFVGFLRECSSLEGTDLPNVDEALVILQAYETAHQCLSMWHSFIILCKPEVSEILESCYKVNSIKFMREVDFFPTVWAVLSSHFASLAKPLSAQMLNNYFYPVEVIESTFGVLAQLKQIIAYWKTAMVTVCSRDPSLLTKYNEHAQDFKKQQEKFRKVCAKARSIVNYLGAFNEYFEKFGGTICGGSSQKDLLRVRVGRNNYRVAYARCLEDVNFLISHCRKLWGEDWDNPVPQTENAPPHAWGGSLYAQRLLSR
jgi:hypothetical protein